MRVDSLPEAALTMNDMVVHPSIQGAFGSNFNSAYGSWQYSGQPDPATASQLQAGYAPLYLSFIWSQAGLRLDTATHTPIFAKTSKDFPEALGAEYRVLPLIPG